ncbi:hypothetical protein E4T52_06601 [Aureobasidium sp. EXF-3400]|nr:hypothetical protein E4T51_07326 [Aureobasidium sp. EXF-12344]KAI4778475.1 hypothetical protein E4T52_06601 [Aureobasidium sp. EXF-3400]
MGVEYVSRNQMFFWSCQHSLCGLESAVFLCKWLQAVAATSKDEPLTAHESAILDWVRKLVDETRQSINLEQLGVTSQMEVSALQPSQLCTIVLRIWARVFSGNFMWAIIDQIGSALEQLAQLIEAQSRAVAGHLDRRSDESSDQGSWDDVMRVIGQAHSLLHENGVVRIQSDIRVGSRTDKKQTSEDKVAAVKAILDKDEQA